MTALASPTLSSTSAERDVRGTELLARVTDLVPLVREHAARGSENRRIAPEVIQALDDAGVFHMLLPERLGGAGLTMRAAVDVMSEVARGDGSTGWVVSLLSVGTGFGSTYSLEAQDEVFGTNPKAKISGTFTPGTRAERVEGGYTVSGQWPWSSGSFTADWATLGIVVDGGEMALALIPSTAWTIEPTWFVAGMQGTGSDTIVVKDHFVPDHRIQTLPKMFAADFASPFRDEQMASMPFNAVASAILAAPQIGLGKHALELTRAKLPGKAVAYSAYQQAKSSPTHQLGVAKAAAKLNLAELALHQMCDDIDIAASTHQMPELLTLGRIRTGTGLVAELTREAIDLLLTANGAGSFATANVLQRVWRDSETAGRHALVTPEIGYEAYGRLLLGNDEPIIGL